MNREENAYNQLLDGIRFYVENCIENSSMDKTTRAVVKEVGQDKYTITINGKDYYNVPTIGGNCHENEIVTVLIPQNQYNNIIILKGGKDYDPSYTNDIYEGAKSAGYTGTQKEFGIDLCNTMTDCAQLADLINGEVIG